MMMITMVKVCMLFVGCSRRLLIFPPTFIPGGEIAKTRPGAGHI